MLDECPNSQNTNAEAIEAYREHKTTFRTTEAGTMKLIDEVSLVYRKAL